MNNNQNLASQVYPNPDDSQIPSSKIYIIFTIILTVISLLWAFYAAGLMRQSTCDSAGCIIWVPILYFPNLVLAIISVILIRLHFKHSEKVYRFKFLYYLIILLLPLIFFGLSTLCISKVDNFYLSYINRSAEKLISVKTIIPTEGIILPKNSIILELQGVYYAFDKKSQTTETLNFANAKIFFSDDKSKYAILNSYKENSKEAGNKDSTIKIIDLKNEVNSWEITKKSGDGRFIDSLHFTADGNKLIIYLQEGKNNGRFDRYGVFNLQNAKLNFYDKSTLDKKFSYTKASVYPKCKSLFDEKGLVDAPQNEKYYSTGTFNKNCDSSDPSEPEYIVLDKCEELFDYNNLNHRKNFEDYNPCKAGQKPDNIIIKYLPNDPNNSKIIFDPKKMGLGQAKISNINISKDFGLFFKVITGSSTTIYNLDNNLISKQMVEIKNSENQNSLSGLGIVAEY